MAETMARAALIIYKKIVDGDLRKFSATSNNDPNDGGGARDLRFSPVEKFMPAFARMFPHTEDGIHCGQFCWAGHAPTKAEIRPPTASRPNEVRIARVHRYFPSDVVPKSSRDCILLLILDENGAVWPCFTSEASLQNDNWHPTVKNAILAGLRARRARDVTPMGIVDLENGGTYTNGRQAQNFGTA